MALITRENAAEMARRSQEARKANRAAMPPAANIPASDTFSAEIERKRTLARQIDLLDADIAKAKAPALRIKLIGAKAKLWELLYPKPGSLRPKAGRTTAPALHPIPAPLPIEPAPALVPGDPEENHKTEIIQSQVAA
jgi:hypothetical protein